MPDFWDSMQGAPSIAGGAAGAVSMWKNLALAGGKFGGLTTEKTKKLNAFRTKALKEHGRYLKAQEYNKDLSDDEIMQRVESAYERALNIVEAEPISVLAGKTTENITAGDYGMGAGAPTPITQGTKYMGTQAEVVKQAIADLEAAKIVEEKGDIIPAELTQGELKTYIDNLKAQQNNLGVDDTDEYNKLKAEIDRLQKKWDDLNKPVPDLTKGTDGAKVTDGAGVTPKGTIDGSGSNTPGFESMLDGGFNPELRKVQLDQVPISQYTKGLPSMLPGGSIAPLQASYENMMPQLQTAYSMAQKLGMAPIDELKGSQGSSSFEAWLSTNPNMELILQKGLDRLEIIRATINAEKTDLARNAAISRLEPADMAIFTEYLAPSYNADGTINDAYAGAKNERNLRMIMNQWLPAQTRYSANRALDRNFNQAMTANPLDQYNLYQGMDRPQAFGESPYPFTHTAMQPIPTANRALEAPINQWQGYNTPPWESPSSPYFGMTEVEYRAAIAGETASSLAGGNTNIDQFVGAVAGPENFADGTYKVVDDSALAQADKYKGVDQTMNFNANAKPLGYGGTNDTKGTWNFKPIGGAAPIIPQAAPISQVAPTPQVAPIPQSTTWGGYGNPPPGFIFSNTGNLIPISPNNYAPGYAAAQEANPGYDVLQHRKLYGGFNG